MEKNSLNKFIMNMREIWGALNSDLVRNAQALVDELNRTPRSESWLADLIQNPRESVELYRDPQYGFILLAHTEKQGLYRVPHDHGNGWVVYALHSGEMQMSTYGKAGQIVRRETYRVIEGQSRVYLPGDIHDTKCLSESVLMFRFTSCDFQKEAIEGRLKRYPEAR